MQLNYNVLSIVYMFPALKVKRLESSTIILAHNKFLSFYDIIMQKWIHHVVFTGGDIFDVFEIMVYGNRKLGVVLSNGDIFIQEAWSLLKMDTIE
jgi:hypothetical protein